MAICDLRSIADEADETEDYPTWLDGVERMFTFTVYMRYAIPTSTLSTFAHASIHVRGPLPSHDDPSHL